MQRANVEMIELGNRLGFALETSSPLGIVCEMTR